MQQSGEQADKQPGTYVPRCLRVLAGGLEATVPDPLHRRSYLGRKRHGDPRAPGEHTRR